MNATTMPARFALGQILIAPQAEERLEAHEVRSALRRHARGDWGEVTPDEVTDNERGLHDGGHLLSVFRDGRDERFCILTNGNRSATLVVTWAEN